MSLTAALAKNLGEECPTCFLPLDETKPLLLDLNCGRLIHAKCVIDFFGSTGQVMCTSCVREGNFVVHQHHPDNHLPFCLGPLSIASRIFEKHTLKKISFTRDRDGRIKPTYENLTEVIKSQEGHTWNIIYYNRWTKQYNRHIGSECTYLFKRAMEGLTRGCAAYILPFTVLAKRSLTHKPITPSTLAGSALASLALSLASGLGIAVSDLYYAYKDLR